MPAPLKFDVVFLDHLKPLYTIDLKVMEEEGLVGPVSLHIPDYRSGRQTSLVRKETAERNMAEQPRYGENWPLTGQSRFGQGPGPFERYKAVLWPPRCRQSKRQYNTN